MQKEDEHTTELPKEYWNCHYRSIQNHFEEVITAVNTSNYEYLRVMLVPIQMEHKIREFLLLKAEKEKIRKKVAICRK